MARTYEAGTYRGPIVRVQVGESKEKGTPQIVFTFEVNERKVGDDWEPMDGQERSVFRYLTDKTAEYVAKDLKALGYPFHTFDQIDPEHSQAHNFVGTEVPVRLKYEPYQGEDKEKWEFAFGGGGLEVKPLARSKFAGLNAAFGKHLKAAGGAAVPPPPPRQHAAPTQADDGSVPF